MASKSYIRQALLVLANVFIPLACYIFATGFFPYKPLLPELATFEAQHAAEELGLLTEQKNGELVADRPARLFNKVIFMVVDALRSDFVYSEQSGFQFVQSLIRDGTAFPFTAYAAAPTVTMPRVKALTTGSVPSFADLILNLDESDTSSSLAHQDTWLAQIRQHLHSTGSGSFGNGSIAFYGDDTWLKLFPDFFAIHDGTSSFFVSDFTEVDNNVTRHMPSALKSTEWDAMIMHYLGLDHIGHKTGPQGPNMLPKQREMDGIIRQIYASLESEPHLKDTLLVLAGDHGMNSAGNHGGSGAGETSTALVFASPKLQRRSAATKRSDLSAPISPIEGSEFDFYAKIQQSDLVPTLSVLLDIPIPKNSLGIIIPELLDLYWDGVLKSVQNPYLQLLYRNALQILEIIKATYGAEEFSGLAGKSMKTDKCSYGFTGMVQLQCLWGRAQRMILAGSLDGRFTVKQQAQALKDFLAEAQKTLSAAASSYDVTRLASGIALSTTASIAAFFSIRSLTFDPPVIGFSLLTALYGIMMFASSYVEEEQHIWYWATSAWLAVTTVSRLRNSRTPLVTGVCGFLLLSLHRIANRWNQTGQKHAGAPDMSRHYFPSDTGNLWLIATLAYVYFGTGVTSRSLKGIFPPAIASILVLATVVCGMIFKFNFTLADAPELVGKGGGPFSYLRRLVEGHDLVFQARVTFTLLGLLFITTLAGHSAQSRRSTLRVRLIDRLFPLLSLLLLTQSRVTNCALFAVYGLQLSLLRHLVLSSEPPAQVISLCQKLSSILGTELAYAYVKVDGGGSRRTADVLSFSVLLLTYTSFYQLGNSNAISSIDLSQAYNGVSSYNMGAVGILLFLSNWAGPIWWTTAGLSMLFEAQDLLGRTKQTQQASDSSLTKTVAKEVQTMLGSAVDQLDQILDDPLTSTSNGNKDSAAKRRKSKARQSLETASTSSGSISPSRVTTSVPPKDSSRVHDRMTNEADSPFQQYITWTTLFTAASLAATMLSCTILRTHLFIWTVFSPKYLFAMAWAAGWHLAVNIFFGGLLRAAG